MGRRAQPHHPCHFCNKTGPSRFLVCCQSVCDLSFCRKCLTRHYKYSRPKCAKLPSVSWKCPVCTRKYRCKECLQSTAILSIKGKDKKLVKGVLYKKCSSNRPSVKSKKPNSALRTVWRRLKSTDDRRYKVFQMPKLSSLFPLFQVLSVQNHAQISYFLRKNKKAKWHFNQHFLYRIHLFCQELLTIQ